jgi:hypothetical protein
MILLTSKLLVCYQRSLEEELIPLNLFTFPKDINFPFQVDLFDFNTNQFPIESYWSEHIQPLVYFYIFPRIDSFH